MSSRRLVAALAVSQTIGYGALYYAFAVLLTPLAADLGASTTAVTGAFTCSVITGAVLAVPVGRWLDRHGGRALMTAGSLAGALLLLAWAGVQELWQLYAVQIGIGAAAAASLYEAAFAVVVAWSAPRRRSGALLAVTVVAGFASTIFLPLTGWLVAGHGWRAALVVLAAIQAATVPLHAAAVRRPPPAPHLPSAEPPGRSSRSSPAGAPGGRTDPSRAPAPDGRTDPSRAPAPDGRTDPSRAPAPDGRTDPSCAGVPGERPGSVCANASSPPGGAEAPAEPARSRPAGDRPLRVALRDRSFWLLAAGFTAHTAAVSVVTVHLVAALIAWGHPATFAAAVAGLLGALSVAGRIVTTGLHRRFRTAPVTAAVFAVQAAAAAALPVVGSSRAGAVAAVTLFGLGFGVATLARPLLLAERYGTERFATLAGVLVVPVTLAKAAAPLLAAAATSYAAVLAAVAACCAIAAAGILTGGQKLSRN